MDGTVEGIIEQLQLSQGMLDNVRGVFICLPVLLFWLIRTGSIYSVVFINRRTHLIGTLVPLFKSLNGPGHRDLSGLTLGITF